MVGCGHRLEYVLKSVATPERIDLEDPGDVVETRAGPSALQNHKNL